MLTTNQKGAIAETAIAHAAVRLGIGVSKPLADLPYDLVFDLGGRLLRVRSRGPRAGGRFSCDLPRLRTTK